MAITHCKDCNAQISTEARKCPHCGKPNKSVITGIRVVIVILAVLLVWLWFKARQVDASAAMESAKIEEQVRSLRQASGRLDNEIYNAVASDAVAQYEIAKRQGDPIQICVQAGLVSAAYLQAKQSDNYNRWKAIETSNCRRAGVSE